LIHAAHVVLAAGVPCPDLSAFKPVLDRAVGLLLAVIGASFLAVVVYAAVKYETALGRQEGVMQGKEILAHAGKGLALAALAPALVEVIKWVLGATGICGF
jgi:hypothetical protein